MATIDPLPPSLVDSLSRFPSAGERNVWLFTVATQARHIASPKKVHRFLQRIVSTAAWTDRDFSREIDRVVQRAYFPSQSISKSRRSHHLSPAMKAHKWPEYDEQLWDRYITTPAIFNLDPIPIQTEDVIDQLYVSESLLCCSRSVWTAVTQSREQWRGMEAAMEFIVANPMTDASGRTQDGKLSHRCHDNATKSRLYQVVEFDRGSLNEQAAILSSLYSNRAPLILVVYSGGKSLHGWFDVRNLTESDKSRFFSAACRLGADSTLWDPCKLVRMPGGRRSNGKPQPILHFSPNVD